MNQRAAKKLRQQARRELRRHTRPELRWWAHPRVLRVWGLAGTWAVHALARLGWQAPSRRWLAIIQSIPQRGVRYVVR